MTKRIDIDGKSYRVRRGKLVEIPSAWVGKFPTKKTIADRPSKMINKRKRDSYGRSWSKRDCEFKDQRDLPLDD